MPHQQELFDATDGYDNVGYFVDMGLGKTFIGSEALKRFGNDVNLVICQKAKIDDWMAHFDEYYDFEVFDLTQELDAFMATRAPRVGVINYELAFRRVQLKALEGITLMLDESSLIQNEQAKRSRFTLSLNARHTILLSGTIVNGNYERLWSQCNLLGWPISKKMFYDHYIVTENVNVDGYWRKVPTGEYKNVERLKRKLRGLGAVFLKTDEVFDLPLQNIEIVDIQATNAYTEFIKHRVVKVDDKLYIGDMQLTARLYERMLCGHLNPFKLARARTLIESTDDRLIIFYTFTQEYNALKEICDGLDRRVSTVNGETKDLRAYEERSDSVTLVQWQAGAMGLNLQKANKMIMFSLPDGWSEGYEQGLKRIHRIGQKRPCFYYILMVKNSIEGEIYQNLLRKRDITNELFEDPTEAPMPTTEIQTFESEYLASFKQLAELSRSKKDLEAIEKDLKAEIEKAMYDYGVKSIDNDYIRINYVEPTETVTIDLKAFEQAEPREFEELIDDYPKVTKRKGYVRFTVK